MASRGCSYSWEVRTLGPRMAAHGLLSLWEVVHQQVQQQQQEQQLVHVSMCMRLCKRAWRPTARAETNCTITLKKCRKKTCYSLRDLTSLWVWVQGGRCACGYVGVCGGHCQGGLLALLKKGTQRTRRAVAAHLVAFAGPMCPSASISRRARRDRDELAIWALYKRDGPGGCTYVR
jgi:hypothetical protein